jgi:hypothetical protein
MGLPVSFSLYKLEFHTLCTDLCIVVALRNGNVPRQFCMETMAFFVGIQVCVENHIFMLPPLIGTALDAYSQNMKCK